MHNREIRKHRTAVSGLLAIHQQCVSSTLVSGSNPAKLDC